MVYLIFNIHFYLLYYLFFLESTLKRRYYFVQSQNNRFDFQIKYSYCKWQICTKDIGF